MIWKKTSFTQFKICAPVEALHNVYFVKYDVTVSFMAQVGQIYIQ